MACPSSSVERRKALLLALPVLAGLGFVLALDTVIDTPSGNDTTSPRPQSSEEAPQPDPEHGPSIHLVADPANTVSPTRPPAPRHRRQRRPAAIHATPAATRVDADVIQGNGGIAGSSNPKSDREKALYTAREEPHSDPSPSVDGDA